jgi:hypothetical protein
MTETRSLFDQVLNDFRTLTRHLEGAIEAFAHDEKRGVDLGALHRARDAASRGAELAQIGWRNTKAPRDGDGPKPFSQS